MRGARNMAAAEPLHIWTKINCILVISGTIWYSSFWNGIRKKLYQRMCCHLK